MKRIELKEFIENKIEEITALKKEESDIVVAIVNKCINELLLIEDYKFRSETNSEIFAKSVRILKQSALKELTFLENKNESYLSNNFFQIKMTLIGIIDCLNVNQD